MHIGPSAVLPSLRFPMTPATHIPQCAQRRVRQEKHTSTGAATTTIRAAPRNELLVPKAYRTGATITTSDANLCMVDHSNPPLDIILWQNIIDEMV